MLTIRASRNYPTGPRNEVVLQAAYVILGGDSAKTNGIGTQVEFYNADHSTSWPAIQFGDVYVMNEAGKTVATYNLPHSPVEGADKQ